MGGRGSSGGSGSWTKKGTDRHKNKTSGGSGSGSKGGSGSSGGGGGAGGGGSAGAGSGVGLGGGSAGGAGGGGGTTPVDQRPTLAIDFGPGLSSAQRQEQLDKLSKLPDHISKKLRELGTKINVGRRADESPGWAAMAAATGWDSDTTSGDGRELGTLSFYIPSRNEVYISVNYPGGSVNVYTHELGHSIDAQFLRQSVSIEFPPDSGDMHQVYDISDDPYWQDLHERFVLTNTRIRDYYKTGSNGSHRSGRSELFAEGFAVYTERGIIGLRGFVGGREPADLMLEVWRRYGVVQ